MKGRTLVAEYDRNLRRVLKAMLVREGYDVAEAADGAAAQAWLSANRADSLVSDIRMPKVDGLALFRHCREKRPECSPSPPRPPHGLSPSNGLRWGARRWASANCRCASARAPDVCRARASW